MSKRFLTVLLCSAMLAVACDEKEDDGATSGDCDLEISQGSGEQVTLDSVDGLYAVDSVQAGVPITFYIRITNNTDDAISGLTHGFRICSPDGARWATTIGDTTGTVGQAQFDLVFSLMTFSVTGSGADTVGFGGNKLYGPGLLPGFDDIVYTVQIGPIGTSYHGDRICIDSSWFPPGGDWLWANGSHTVYPDWDGARCFRIVNPASLSSR
jgi:hypothetical protein